MASYFYLMSSLPMLKPGAAVPISYEKFLDYCSGNISGDKYNLLANLSVNSTEGPLVREWSEFYYGFHGELTYQRSKKAGVSVGAEQNKNSEFEKAIASAISDANPLNAEKSLLEIQFKKIDELIGLHSYDDYALFGYAIKLKLLERSEVFDTEKGKAELNRLVKGLEEKIEQMQKV